jgi:hypothetical protein
MGYSGNNITISDLINELSVFSLTLSVRYDFLYFNFSDDSGTVPIVLYPGEPHSYRGYYEDITFVPSTTPITVADFIAALEDVIGKEFVGWKGGDYIMNENTSVWAAEEGSGGNMITGTELRGDTVILLTMEDDY